MLRGPYLPCGMVLCALVAAMGSCDCGGETCSRNQDCGGAGICIEGLCHRACEKDLDCPQGQVCSNGACWDEGERPRSDAAVADSARPDSAAPDALRQDAARADAGRPDSAAPDSAAPDSAALDQGVADGAGPVDAAVGDSALVDAGQPDADAPDSAPADANQDAAQVDASGDAGVPDAFTPDALHDAGVDAGPTACPSEFHGGVDCQLGCPPEQLHRSSGYDGVQRQGYWLCGRMSFIEGQALLGSGPGDVFRVMARPALTPTDGQALVGPNFTVR